MTVRQVLAYCLFPLTMWYGIVVWFRNLFFDLGILKQQTPHITTIGVGNLACGGTGKTPHVEYLLRLLGEQHNTAMLSRGYRRRSKGYQQDDGNHSAEQLGDEAAMVAEKFPNVTVAVCKQRVAGVERLMQDNPDLQLVVLDDVMQHRYIRPSLTILLTDYNHPFYEDHILPYGNLRESRRGRSRANIIIVTKSPENLNPIDRHNITNAIGARTYQKIFFSYVKYGALTHLFDGSRREVEGIEHVLCFSGIANARPLVEHLQQFSSVDHLSFADHHEYRQSDIDLILKHFEGMPTGKCAIVTTEKDAARLRQSPLLDQLASLPLYSIEIQVKFHDNGSLPFDEELKSIVRENVIFQNRLALNRQKSNKI